ncbi:MAG: PT domain-containing protein [Flaviflexus sp.]|nr:PT domain-containing protein [Flaviflexus sp.]
MDDAVRRLSDPHCPLPDIVAIATAHPQLHHLAAGHPGADGQLLRWLATTSPDPAARDLAGRRLAGDPSDPPAPQYAAPSTPPPGQWGEPKRSPALMILAVLALLLILSGAVFGILHMRSDDPALGPTPSPTGGQADPSEDPSTDPSTDPTADPTGDPTAEPTEEWPTVIPESRGGYYSEMRVEEGAQPIEGLGPFEEHFDTDSADPYISHNTEMFELRDGGLFPLFGGGDKILRVNDSIVTFGNYDRYNKRLVDLRTNEEIPIPQEVDGLILYFAGSVDTDLILAFYKDANPNDILNKLSDRQAFVAFDRAGNEVWRMMEHPAPGCAMGMFTAEWGQRFAEMTGDGCDFVLDQHTGIVYDDTPGVIVSENDDALFTARLTGVWIYDLEDYSSVEEFDVDNVERIDGDTEDVRAALTKLEEYPRPDSDIQILAGGNVVEYSYDLPSHTVEWAGKTYPCGRHPVFIDYGRQMICPAEAGDEAAVWEKGAEAPLLTIPQIQDGPYLTRFNTDQWLLQNYTDYAYLLEPAQ